MKSSVRNHLEGTVTSITRGEAVSEIDIETAAGMMSSIITTRSLSEMGIQVGDKVTAAVKSTAVFVEKR